MPLRNLWESSITSQISLSKFLNLSRTHFLILFHPIEKKHIEHNNPNERLQQIHKLGRFLFHGADKISRSKPPCLPYEVLNHKLVGDVLTANLLLELKPQKFQLAPFPEDQTFGYQVICLLVNNQHRASHDRLWLLRNDWCVAL